MPVNGGEDEGDQYRQKGHHSVICLCFCINTSPIECSRFGIRAGVKVRDIRFAFILHNILNIIFLTNFLSLVCPTFDIRPIDGATTIWGEAGDSK